MTHYLISDDLYDDPGYAGLPPSAGWLWVRAGSWCCRYLTDGRVPRGKVAELGGRKRDVDALIAAGLWAVAQDGFTFVRWGESQRTKAEVEAYRSSAAERKRVSRSRVTGGVTGGVTSVATGGVTGAVSPGSNPIPIQSNPDPIPDQKRGESACVAAPPLASEPVRVELPDAAPRQHRTQPSSVHWQEVHSGWAAAWEDGGHGTPPRPVGAAREAAIEFARDVAARASVDLYTAAKAIGVAALRLPPSKRVWGLAEVDPYASTKEAPRDPSFARLVSAAPKFLTVAEMAAEGRSK